MRASGDRLGEAKASGNIGNTLKAMGKFDEAMAFCRRHQDIAKELGERGTEAKALYNLGNVCHARGKVLGLPALYDPGEYPPDCNKSFEEAAKYFEENVEILRELRDRHGLGRTFGNLGNTYYVLGHFTKAIRCHEERLLLSKEFGDVLSERRAYTNLGNANMFLGEFLVAADYFNKALQIARQVRDRGLEAQSCYSLGNTYTLLRDFDKAIEYHIMHLRIAQELKDRLGEGRACWSLGNAFKSMGQLQKALLYAGLHMEISKEVGDDDGQVTGQSMLAELRTMLGTGDETTVKRVSSCREKSEGRIDRDASLLNRSRRSSMENLDLVDSGTDKSSDQTRHLSSVRLKAPKISKTASLRSNDSKQKPAKKSVGQSTSKSTSSFDLDDSFLDLLSKFQSRRIDDQRCCSSVLELGSRTSSTLETESEADKENDGFQANSPNADEFFDMVAGIQGSRMDDQRADIFPGLHNDQFLARLISRHHDDDSLLDDQFFEMLIRCQGSRIEDQRSEMPIGRSAPTVPDEDFINLILRFQSSRLDEQRSAMPEGVSKRVAPRKSSFRRKTDKPDKQSR